MLELVKMSTTEETLRNRLNDLDAKIHERSASTAFNYLTNTEKSEPLSNEVSCSFVNIPSIIDIIKSSKDQGDAIESMMNLPDVQLSDAARANGLIFTTRNVFVNTGAKRRVCGKLYDWLRDVTYLGDYECQDYIRVPIAEMHCPHTQGSYTTYKWTSEVGATTSFTVELMGCSAGGGASLKVETKETLTSKGRCLYVSKRCWMKVECWRAKDGKIIYVPRLISITKGLDANVLPLDSHEHFCTLQIDKVRKVLKSFSNNPAYYAHCLPFSLPKEVPATEAASIRAGLIVDIKSKFSLQAMEVPISLNVRVQSTVVNEFGYEINLEGGHDYLGFYKGFSSSAYMWAWAQNGMG